LVQLGVDQLIVYRYLINIARGDAHGDGGSEQGQ
jgi:hypothetical protein